MSNCNIPNTDPLYDNENCPDITSNIPATTPSCQISPITGVSCPGVDNCSPWSLADQSSDSCIVEEYIAQSLVIGGAIVNVYKLLGVHEQGKLQDLTGNGAPLSNGYIPNYPPSNAFDKYITEWRSSQLGTNIIKEAYIGYDFGEIKLENGRNRYGIETFIRHDVSTIKIKQGCNSTNRATKIRIERSNDGTKWYGVAVVDLKDCDGLLTVNFNRSVPSRWWRIRPIKFNGLSTDWWAVQALQLVDYEATNINNIQDKIFLENRDRDYDEYSVEVKGTYTPPDIQSFQSKFGMSGLFGGGDTYSIEVSFKDIITKLGRPLVIGDIINLPSETQYSPSLKPIYKYLEITNVAWSTNGYTANWKPTLQRILAEPLTASQETQDILGKLTVDVDSTGLADLDNGDNSKAYQDMADIDQTIKADANTAVPERGEDFAEVTKFSDDVYEWASQYPNLDMKKFDRNVSVFGIDALPPNGLSYTQGDDFPLAPKNGDYHRLTYTQINNTIPARLYKYSIAKSRWIYLATDRREEHKNTKPILQEFLNPESSTRTPPPDLKNP